MSTAQDIVKALGGKWYGAYGLTYCPAHDNQRTPALSVREASSGDGAGDGVIVHCHAGCDWRDVKAALRARGLLPELDRTERRWRPTTSLPVTTASDRGRDQDVERRSELAQEIWRKANPAKGSAVEAYLKSRGITLDPPPALRVAILKHGPTGLWFPTMVAAVRDVSGQVVAVHRTFLLPDGRNKAQVSQPRMMLGPCAGGAVRLAEASHGVVLAEGIETGLSVQQATGKAVWATLSTSGLKGVVLPPDMKAATIAADGDEPGLAAAEEAAARLTRQELSVKIARPSDGFADFNEMLSAPDNVLPFKGRTAHG